MLGSIPPVLLSVVVTLAPAPGQQPATGAEAIQAQALTLLARKDFDGAIAALSAAIDLDEAPSRLGSTAATRRQLATRYCSRGQARAEKGDVENAIADFDKAIALDPTIADAYVQRAFLRERDSDPQGALRDYSKALELAPSSGNYYNRGYALMKRWRLTEALRDFEIAIELDPTMPLAYQWRGTIRLDMGQIDGVLADAEQLIARAPTHFYGYFLRGMARVWQSRDADADLDLQTCYTLNPAARAAIEQFVADARRSRSQRKHETLTVAHPAGSRRPAGAATPLQSRRLSRPSQR